MIKHRLYSEIDASGSLVSLDFYPDANRAFRFKVIRNCEDQETTISVESDLLRAIESMASVFQVDRKGKRRVT